MPDAYPDIPFDQRIDSRYCQTIILHDCLTTEEERNAFHEAFHTYASTYKPPLFTSHGRYGYQAITLDQAMELSQLPPFKICHQRYLIQLKAKRDHKLQKLQQLEQEIEKVTTMCE